MLRGPAASISRNNPAPYHHDRQTYIVSILTKWRNLAARITVLAVCVCKSKLIDELLEKRVNKTVTSCVPLAEYIKCARLYRPDVEINK